MPYTRVWSNANVPGTFPANEIDKEFRDSKVDIQERLDDVLVVNITADPLVLQDSVSGKTVGKLLLIPHSLFLERTGGSGNIDISDNAISVCPDRGKLYAAVQLPPGVTVKQLEFLVEIFSRSVNWEFYKVSFTTGVKTSIASGNDATLGLHIVSSGVLGTPELIVGTHSYYVSVDVGGTSDTLISLSLSACRITYDTPSHQNTI